jgi:hypothetical protein
MDGWAEEIPDAAGKLVTRRLVREISELAGATLGRSAAVSKRSLCKAERGNCVYLKDGSWICRRYTLRS